MRMLSHRTALIAMAAVVLGGCDGFITEGTEEAWKEKYALALLPGYTEFKGLGISADVGVAVFSYRIDVGGANAAALVARQIESGSCFRPVATTALEAQLRCKTARAMGPFEEYRVRANPNTRRVTVMYGDFDSQAEIDHYDRFATMFRKHAETQ